MVIVNMFGVPRQTYIGIATILCVATAPVAQCSAGGPVTICKVSILSLNVQSEAFELHHRLVIVPHHSRLSRYDAL